MRSIKTKFVIILGIIVFIVCAGLGTVSYLTSKQAITVVAKDLMIQMVSESAKAIESKINYHYGLLTALANTDFIRDPDIPIEEKTQYLKEVAEREGYDSFGIGDTAGAVLTLDGFQLDLSEREYYQFVLKDNQVVTDPIISKANGKLIVNYAVPIKDKNKKIIGVLIGSRNGDELSNMTNDIQIAKTGKSYMLNKVGITVAHYDQEMVINQVNPIDLAKEDSSLNDLAEITSHIIKGENGFSSYKYEGVNKYVAYAPVENSGWLLAITVPEIEILSSLDSLKRGVFTVSIIFLFIGLITIYFISDFIARKIKSITSQLNLLSKGDFSTTPDYKPQRNNDEIADAHHSLQIMQKSVSSMITAIKGTSENIADQTNNLTAVSQQMASASENISFSIQETGKGISSQAEGLTDINQIIYNFGERIDNIVINIANIDSNTKDINQMSSTGNENMKQLIESINIVSNAFTDFKVKIEGLSINIGQITDITNVINGIAEQTNLLSLNAAIEAARAGESGKGFAVVASEIRKLAEQSQRSSQSIDNLISNISEDAGVIINTTSDLSKELDLQVGIIKNAIESYRNIVNAIVDIGAKIQTVNVSAGEINHEKTQILDRVSDASSVSEEVASSSEEIASAAEELAASSEEVAGSADKLSIMTQNMLEQVGKFKV